MALTKIDDRGLKTPIDLQDNEKIRLGTGNDLEIFHNGSHSKISDTGTGSLILSGSTVEINNAADSENMIKAVENGAVELYHDNSKKFETYANGCTVTGNLNAGNVDLADNAKARFGGSNDLQIYHNGTNSIISNDTGDLILGAGNGSSVKLQPEGGEDGLTVNQNGGVELYHDNSKKLETTSYGAVVTGTLSAGSGNFDVADNGIFKAGNSSDLQIYHNGTHSYLSNGTGNLFVEIPESQKFQVQHGSETIINGYADGRVELYHDNSKKFSTISDGIEVHGSTDSARIEFNDAYSNSRIGYFGLNRFGIDAHDGLEIRDPSDSYATRLMIDASGRLLLGDTSPTTGVSTGHIVSTFNGNADNGLKTRDTSGAGSVNHCVFVSQSTAVGSITGSSSSISYSNLSDYRTKENVTAISDGITRLKTLKPSRFNFKVDKDTTVDGFLAHEVTPAVPEAVTGEKDAVDSNGKINPQMLDSSKLVPLLTAALQEEISKREALETRVAALEAA